MEKISRKERELYATMDRLSKDTGLDEFVFFGGYPIDLLSGIAHRSEVNDFDVAIQGTDVRRMKEYETRIRQHRYVITRARRHYVIRRRDSVFTTYAKKGNTILDANFMEDPTKVGLFNVDSLYVTYPDLNVIDRYNCLEGIRGKTITPIIKLDDENPYFLAARFIYLGAKYEISMVEPRNRGVANEIVRRMINEPVDPRGEFDSFLASILRSILRSRDKLSYIRELIQLEILRPRLPELDIALRKIIDGKIRAMQRAKNAHDLVELLARYIPRQSKDKFLRKIGRLSHRSWEHGKRRIHYEYING